MQFLSIFQPVTPNYEVGADFLNHLLLLELDQAAIAVPHKQARWHIGNGEKEKSEKHNSFFLPVLWNTGWSFWR